MTIQEIVNGEPFLKVQRIDSEIEVVNSQLKNLELAKAEAQDQLVEALCSSLQALGPVIRNAVLTKMREAARIDEEVIRSSRSEL